MIALMALPIHTYWRVKQNEMTRERVRKERATANTHFAGVEIMATISRQAQFSFEPFLLLFSR